MTYFGVMDCEGRMRFAARNMAKVKKAVTAGRQNADLCSACSAAVRSLAVGRELFGGCGRGVRLSLSHCLKSDRRKRSNAAWLERQRMR